MDYFSDSVTAVVLSRDNKTIVTGTECKEIQIWSLTQDSGIYTQGDILEENKGPLTVLDMSSSGLFMAMGDDEGKIKIFKKDFLNGYIEVQELLFHK